MDAAGYQRLIENRRARGVRPIGEAAALPRVLRRAALAKRQCDAAAEAWARIAPEWQELAAVDGVRQGTLYITVVDSTAAYDLLRQQAVLTRKLSHLVRDVRNVRFDVGAPHGAEQR